MFVFWLKLGKQGGTEYDISQVLFWQKARAWIANHCYMPNINKIESVIFWPGKAKLLLSIKMIKVI